MKLFTISLLFFHGLIHLIGFAKAYEHINLSNMVHHISKTTGIIFLLTSILFILTSILCYMEKTTWPYFAIFCIIISQCLIFITWTDSKFGTILNILILFLALLGILENKFKNQYVSRVNHSIVKNKAETEALLKLEEIEPLPDAIKKYIQYCGLVGKSKIQNFKIEFEGKLRNHESEIWMPFRSEQYNFLLNPTRHFYLKASMVNFPVAGIHSYNHEKASLDIRLLSIFKIAKQEGNEMLISETVTFFNDMCCLAPSSLIDPRIKWMESDSNKVIASFTNNDITISATLYFNEKGELINFTSADRYALINNKMQKMMWNTPLRDYKISKNGIRYPTYAEAIYTNHDKTFCYGTFTVKSIKYNLNKFDK